MSTESKQDDAIEAKTGEASTHGLLAESRNRSISSSLLSDVEETTASIRSFIGSDLAKSFSSLQSSVASDIGGISESLRSVVAASMAGTRDSLQASIVSDIGGISDSLRSVVAASVAGTCDSLQSSIASDIARIHAPNESIRTMAWGDGIPREFANSVTKWVQSPVPFDRLQPGDSDSKPVVGKPTRKPRIDVGSQTPSVIRISDRTGSAIRILAILKFVIPKKDRDRILRQVMEDLRADHLEVMSEALTKKERIVARASLVLQVAFRICGILKIQLVAGITVIFNWIWHSLFS